MNPKYPLAMIIGKSADWILFIHKPSEKNFSRSVKEHCTNKLSDFVGPYYVPRSVTVEE